MNTTPVKPSRQDIFEISGRHLMTQRKKSINAAGYVCMYRSPEGLMCAAGPFIPDSIYNPDMETNIFRVIVHRYKDLQDHVNMEELQLYSGLQGIHDFNEPSEWKESLRNLGQGYGLNTAFLDEYEDIQPC